VVTNPILSEIQGLSPSAQAALGMAGHALSQGAATPAPVTNAPVITPQLKAAMPQDAGPAPNLAPIKMPGSDSVPSLGAPTSPSIHVLGSSPLGTLQGDKDELQRKLTTGSGESQIMHRIEGTGFGQAHPMLGKILGGVAQGAATLGDIGLSTVAPQIAEQIPGTAFHHLLDVNRENKQVGADEANAAREATTGAENATTAHTQAETAALPQEQKDKQNLTAAQIANYQSEADNRGEAKKTPEEQAYQSLVDKGASPIEAFGQLNQAKNTKDASFQQQFLDAYQKAHPQVPITDAIAATIRATSTQPKIDVHAATERPASEGTWSLQTDTSGKPILFNSKTGETKEAPANIARKPNAEEQKRGDLAENVNENLDKLQDIVTRRPDLFGKIAGRLTQIKELVGTSDPDVADLKTIHDNLGMASQSAHGMRSAQHVEAAANAILNGYHNSPAALSEAIKTARQSVGTFQHDIANPEQAGKPNSEPKSSGLTVSLADARQLPQNKGKTDAEITADIKAHGHEVRQ
jgi:hypothetical protein